MSKAILLLNMGGPSNIEEVELFLRNMFADPNILQTNRLTRKVVGSIIVKKRLREAQENYKAIGCKSPLLEISQKLAEKVESISGIRTLPVMRYVPPFAYDTLKKLKEQNIDELILLPMYPHYSSTTTKSSIEDIYNQCKLLNFTPKITKVEHFFDNKEFIAIQASLIKQALGTKSPKSIKLIISAHGLPLSIIEAGDPYEKHIRANVALLSQELIRMGIHFQEIELAFQSKVGNSAWLEPNLSDLLRNPTNLDVLLFPIAFTVDNSETVFELDIENRDIAQKIGYNSYTVAKCPNDLDAFASFLATLAKSAQ